MDKIVGNETTACTFGSKTLLNNHCFYGKKWNKKCRINNGGLELGKFKTPANFLKSVF
jgi:hypothetical protein